MNSTPPLDPHTALILVDIQKAFHDTTYWGPERSTPEAEKNAARLLTYWREHDLPLYHIQHCSTNPLSPLAEGKAGHAFDDLVQPLIHETVIPKSVNSAFIGTDLRERLDAREITTVSVVGLTTDHCVSTTARMAANYGYQTWVVADATATFDKPGVAGERYSAAIMHGTSLAALAKEFATIVTTDELLTVRPNPSNQLPLAVRA